MVFMNKRVSFCSHPFKTVKTVFTAQHLRKHLIIKSPQKGNGFFIWCPQTNALSISFMTDFASVLVTSGSTSKDFPLE